MSSEDFKDIHRTSSTSFTRKRKLYFTSVLIIILQKSVKSIQLLLNELVLSFDTIKSITNSAFTQARSHLKHTAFIELNQKAIVEIMYCDDDYEKYKGLRILAVDGSKLVLPNTPDLRKEFGSCAYTIGPDAKKGGKYASALSSVCYDVLNHIVIDSKLAPIYSYEGDLALTHLSHTSANDLLLYDRNYPSYQFIAAHIALNRFFVMRSTTSFLKPIAKMFHGTGHASKIVTISQPRDKKDNNLPLVLKVRVIRVILPTGKPEVLITNLFDEEKFPTKGFLTIYNLRWGIETFYSIIKGRLALENFSGKTAESVYQDFYATIYLSGLESVLTQDINEELEQKETYNVQKVNHAVSFNIIKNKAFELLLYEKDQEQLLLQLEQLFRMNPVQYRSHRKVPRKSTSTTQSFNYQKRKKKICF